MWSVSIFVNTALISRGIFDIILTFVSGISWTAYMILARYYLKGGKKAIIPTTYPMTLRSLMLLGTTILARNIIVVSPVDGL